ncbi:MAG TPA: DUF4340 domain-containing protein [Sumerlaeia bacterium]|nr:DUF4340 domain-containing protein [Sumerlaeia bacterium]
MRTRNLIALLIIAAALTAGAIVVYQRQNRASARAQEGERARGARLLPGLPGLMDDISRVEFTKGEDSIVVVRDENNAWAIQSRADCPADPGKILQLFFGLEGMTVADRLTDSPEKYESFGLAGDLGEDGKVRLLDGTGKELAAVMLGKERQSESDEEDPRALPRTWGRYVRAGSDPAVYLSKERLLFLSTEIKEWVDRKICDIATDDVYSVSIDHGSTESLKAVWENGRGRLETVPQGMQEKSASVNTLRSSLVNVQLDDVQLADDLSTLTFATTLAAKLEAGPVYAVKSAEADGKNYIALSAETGEPLISEEDASTTVTLEAARKESEKANGAVADFNKKHSRWVYQLSSDWAAGKFTKKLSDLIEPIPEPEEDKEADTEKEANEEGDEEEG